ncbi:MAG: helicase C-terminal domain-containing protein [Scytolyngbya sp. HA4215-MV1]|jgi:hypothetical protein|nr:helicase C-terminal domain-containing protein [Scytolyngbya sp. HA4215-MV1]
MKTPIELGLIESKIGSVQKRFYLDNAGNLQKDTDHKLSVSSGYFTNLTVEGLEGLATVLKNFKSNNALTLGVAASKGRLDLLKEEKWVKIGKPKGTIARTKECVGWSDGYHPLLFDHDKEPGRPDVSADELWQRVIACVPELNGVGRLVTSSTSSHIYTTSGECLRGDTGHHNYIVVKGDKEKFVELLKVRFWVHGEGFYKLGNVNKQTGVASVLERFLLDITVFSPERLIYEAGADLPEGLVQKRPEPRFYPGDVLDFDLLPEPTSEERAIAEANRSKAHAEIKALQEQKTIEWLMTHERLDRSEAYKEATRAIQYCERGVLRLDHKLYFKGGLEVLAGDLQSHHVGRDLYDPQEPDYDGKRIVAKLYERNGFYYINSFAHGKKVYTIEGVDPIITQNEPEGLNRDDGRAWRRQQVKALATKTFEVFTEAEPNYKAVGNYVNECGFPMPKLGEAILIDAFTGAGKSTQFKQWKDALVLQNNGRVYADLICHRNALARSTGLNMGMQHLNDLFIEGSEPILIRRRIANSYSLAYCIDSFLKRCEFLMSHIHQGMKVLLILDEWNAVLEHLLNGGTIKGNNRQRIIAAFSNLLQGIGDGGGWIIGGEAHLTKLSIDALRELSNNKLQIKVCQITSKNPKPWQVVNYQQGDPGSCKLAAFCKTEELLKAGKRVLVMLGSQEAAEQYEVLLQGGYKVMRVDRDTIAQPETREFVNHINQQLPDSKIQCLIATPTMGTGVDIHVKYFDAVVVYPGMLDPFTAIQMAGRDRNPIPRYMFVPDCANASTEFNPGKLVSKWNTTMGRAAKRANVAESKPRGVIKLSEQIAARLKALHNAGCNVANDIVISMLLKDGHHISEDAIDIETIKELARDFKLVVKDIEQMRLEEYRATQEMSSIEEARKQLKRDDLSREKRLEAIKTVDRHKYGDVIDATDWIYENRSRGTKSDKHRNSLDKAVLHENPDLACEVEKESLTASNAQTGTFWSASFSSEVDAIELLAELGFGTLLETLGEDGYTKDDPALLEFFKQAQSNRTRIREFLGLTITSESTPVRFLNSILKSRFFCTINNTKSKVPHREHIVKDHYVRDVEPHKQKFERIYTIVKFPYRDELIERLKQIALDRIQEAQERREQDVPEGELPTYQPTNNHQFDLYYFPDPDLIPDGSSVDTFSQPGLAIVTTPDGHRMVLKRDEAA